MHNRGLIEGEGCGDKKRVLCASTVVKKAHSQPCIQRDSVSSRSGMKCLYTEVVAQALLSDSMHNTTLTFPRSYMPCMYSIVM